MPGEPSLGILKVPEREGILRAIDGQHRLLALHADMSQFEGETLHRAGGDFRPAPRRSRRPDVRHDQREAHAAERVASRVAVGPAALSRRKPRGGARRRAGVERARGFAALRRDQAARRRPRPRRAGAARAGTEEAVRERSVRPGPQGRRVPRRCEEVLRQLFPPGRRRVRRGLERPQVQHQVGARPCGRSSASRRKSSSGSTSSTRIARTSARSAASSRRGAAASATCGSKPTARGSVPAPPSISSPRNSSSRCSTPKGQWYRGQRAKGRGQR